MNLILIKEFILSFDSNDLYFLVVFTTIAAIYTLVASDEKDVKYSKNDENIDITQPSEGSPPLYTNGWIPVFESNSLKKGEITPFFAFGNDLVAFRGISGKVHVFNAYCPHLGTNLGVGGDVIEESIKCPFHGWVFNNEGKCTFAPGLETANLPKVQLKKWDNIEVNGFLFLWNHSNGEKPNWFPQTLKQITENKIVFRGKLEIPLTGHIQEVSEKRNLCLYLDELEPSPSWIKNLLNNRPLYKLMFSYFSGHFKGTWNGCPAPDQHQAESEIDIDYKLFNYLNFKTKTLIKQIGPVFDYEIIEITLFMFKSEIHLIKGIITTNPLKHKIVYQIFTKPSLLGKLIKIPIFLVNKMVSFIIENQKLMKRIRNLPKNKKSVERFRLWFQQFYAEAITDG